MSDSPVLSSRALRALVERHESTGNPLLINGVRVAVQTAFEAVSGPSGTVFREVAVLVPLAPAPPDNKNPENEHKKSADQPVEPKRNSSSPKRRAQPEKRISKRPKSRPQNSSTNPDGP